jgi:hypothetical protein
MTESDYNTIKPAQNLPDVAALNPAKDSEERNKRQSIRKRPQRRPGFDEGGRNEPAADNGNNNLSKNDTDEHRIDYCA